MLFRILFFVVGAMLAVSVTLSLTTEAFTWWQSVIVGFCIGWTFADIFVNKIGKALDEANNDRA